MNTPRISNSAWIAAAVCLFTTAGAHGQADLASNFDAGADDWRSSNPAASPTWQPVGGAAGGFLQLVTPGGPLQFISPAGWTGDFTSYRALKFGLAIPSRHYADADRGDIVTIVGANSQSMTWDGPTPLFTWTRYEVSLDPASFGVSQATFDAIMANVAEIRIAAEFTAGANETVGIDGVLVTSAPVVVQSGNLIERFTGAVKNGVNLGGWKPVDDVTLSLEEAGRPLFALYGDDHQDGRTFRVATPDSWAGDWRAFTQMALDYKWQSNGSGAGGANVIRIFGANGEVLSWSTSVVEAEWQKLVIPLDAAAFGVDEAAFEAVMRYVSKVEIRGEYDNGNDELWLDNIEVTTGPRATPVFETSLISRFGTDAEGWTVFGNAVLARDATGGFTGGSITCTDAGAGVARFASPDAWSGDWRAFTSLRFLLKPYGSSQPSGPVPLAIYGANGAVLTTTIPQPYLTWTPYTLDLTPARFGVTPAVFQGVMENVAHLTIVGDLTNQLDTTGLDDVSLVTSSALNLAPPEVLATFDTGTEGWRKGGSDGDATIWGLLTTPPAHRTDGNPGGCIAVNDEWSTYTYWLSPEKIAGDWRGYESVSFDLKIVTGTAILAPGSMISIISAGGVMSQSVPTSPLLGQWNHYEFALTPAAFGVTLEVFETIMRDVVMLGIRAEWINGAETEALDNVRISKTAEAYWLWLGGYLNPAQLNDESISGKLADADGDGVVNFNEFIALTSPVDPLSRFAARVEMAPGGTYTVNWQTAAGRSYQVWRSTTLAGPAAWSPAGPPVTGDGSAKSHSDPGSDPKAFFRVGVTRP